MPTMTNTPYHHGDLKNALIQAGLEILASEGLGGLSLRKVAQKAGVSHAAPYSHFADKQALIAAISTDCFKKLHTELEAVQAESPTELLVETAWAYLQFALTHPERFKLMFSDVLEKEKDHPDFVETSQRSFRKLVEVTGICQQAGVLKPGPSEATALTVWSAVHGLSLLLLEGQVPHTLVDSMGARGLLTHTLSQIMQTNPRK